MQTLESNDFIREYQGYWDYEDLYYEIHGRVADRRIQRVHQLDKGQLLRLPIGSQLLICHDGRDEAGGGVSCRKAILVARKDKFFEFQYCSNGHRDHQFYADANLEPYSPDRWNQYNWIELDEGQTPDPGVYVSQRYYARRNEVIHSQAAPKEPVDWKREGF